MRYTLIKRDYMTLHPNASKRATATFDNLENLYNEIHKNKYDYSKAVYLDSKTKMIIICPDHGEFEQSHNKHGTTKQGCPKCAHSAKHNTTSFITKAKETHGDTYDYSKTVYLGVFKPVTIVCKIHGEFTQQPTNHFAGKGCDKCAKADQGLRRRLPFTEFKEKANAVHQNKYFYRNYTKASNKVTITCPDHGDFEQAGIDHLTGRACPKCAKYGFDKSKPAILYILSINNNQLFKIGITNRTVEARFNVADLNQITVLSTYYFEDGTECAEKEKELLTELKEYRYIGPDILSSGNTELVTVNPLDHTKIKMPSKGKSNV